MIVYIDKQQIVDFCNDTEQKSIDGFAYEWENEDVIHIRTTQLLHSFGIQRSALIVSEDVYLNECRQQQSDFVVIVYHNYDTKVLMKTDDGYAEVEATYIPAKEELYSRTKGLIEIDILKNKKVTIIGLGSGGSSIAVELAKAGVGKFALFDFDRLELHNLSRHYCGATDLGRLKVDALYDVIKGKNPYAEIEKFPVDICQNIDLLNTQVENSDLVICATDNNKSRFIISDCLVKYQKVGLFGGVVTRAEGGQVFRYRPGGPCYCCILGDLINPDDEEITDVASARRSGRIAAYVSPEEADAMVQVGLSSDVEPINNLMVKLSLVEMSRGMESGISCLEEDLSFDFYIWANRRERRYANWSPMSNNPKNGPTIMRWYGVRIQKRENCTICGNNKLIIENNGRIQA